MKPSTTKTKWLLALAVLLSALFSCEKPPGPGGRASIKGRVYAYDYDNTQRYKISEGYSAGERVYIIYGNQTVVGKDTRTSIDGSYEFPYLNKGHYKVFVNSLDTSIKVKGNDTEKSIIQEVQIDDAQQVVQLKDFVINK
jgi:hypothetical protein